MHAIRTIGLLVLTVSAGSAYSQLESRDAVVEGRVTDIGTGGPIPGAWVLFESQTQNVNPPAVRADENGRYRAEVPADEYHFRVDAPGFRILETSADAVRPPMALRANTVVTADHQLSRGATISGRVADERGDPVSGATIVAEYDSFERGERYRVRFRSDIANEEGRPQPPETTTDEDGRFSIHGFGEGAYYLVVLRTPDSPIYYPGTSAGPGAVPIQVTADSANSGQEIGGIEVRWRAVPMVPIRGRILNVADPESFSVQVGSDLPLALSTGIDARGDFEVMVPPRMSYQLLATRSFAATLSGDGTRDQGTAEVFVGDRGIDNVSIRAFPAFGLEGRFLWESTPPAGFDWDGINVGLEYRRFGNVGRYGTEATETGEFHMPNTRPVEQHLFVEGLPQGVYVESASHGSVDALAGAFNPADNPNAGLRIVLGNQPAAIRGMVVRGGDSVPGAIVTLVPDGARRQRLDLFQTVAADSEGRFRFDTVVPGTYLVFGWNSIPKGAIENEAFRLPYEPRATRVHVERLGFSEVEVGLIE